MRQQARDLSPGDQPGDPEVLPPHGTIPDDAGPATGQPDERPKPQRPLDTRAHRDRYARPRWRSDRLPCAELAAYGEPQGGPGGFLPQQDQDVIDRASGSRTSARWRSARSRPARGPSLGADQPRDPGPPPSALTAPVVGRPGPPGRLLHHRTPERRPDLLDGRTDIPQLRMRHAPGPPLLGRTGSSTGGEHPSWVAGHAAVTSHVTGAGSSAATPRTASTSLPRRGPWPRVS